MLRFLKSEEALELLNNLDLDDSDIEIAVFSDVSELTDEDEGDDNEVNTVAFYYLIVKETMRHAADIRNQHDFLTTTDEIRVFVRILLLTDCHSNTCERDYWSDAETLTLPWPQSNRTERVNRELLQIIASFINDNHETWDQFLHEFIYVLPTAFHQTTGNTPAVIFGQKAYHPFQKLVMVSDRAEFERERSSPCNLRPRNSVTKEDGSGISGRAVQVQGGPVLSRIEPFRKPSLYNQHIQGGHSKQQGRQQPEQSQRSGRSRPHIPVQSRHSRQQDRQEPKDSPASRRSESLDVHIGDIKEE
ncbi:hypothetical protein TNCV_4575011 [Trichonephila clavipes]|nr:hypothetical protein TNCV_4575011 [Trichonephila clavipes]